MLGPSASRQRRERLISRQLLPAGIDDARVLEAFRSVPRELFVPEGWRRRFAYAPFPLEIGCGQTISQPAIVARMVQLACIGPGDRILDVGAGSGYQTALVSKLCKFVYGIELLPELGARANRALRAAGIENAEVHVGDGAHGLPEFAPYDAIVVAAAALRIPPALLDQLKDGGRLVLPVGPHLSKRQMLLRFALRLRSPQRLLRVTRRGSAFEREEIQGVYFVPFVSPH